MSITAFSRPGARRVAATVAAAGMTLGVAAAVALGGDPAGAAYRPVSTYTVSKSGQITGKASQQAGRVAWNIDGHKGELFQLVRSRHGAGTNALLADDAVLNGKGTPLPLERDFELKGGATVGQTFYGSLAPGEYYALDVNNRHLTNKGVKHIHVSGKSVNVSVSSTIIRAVHDTSWSDSPKSIPASGVIQFQNKADQSHFIELIRLKKGKGRADIGKVFAGKEDGDKVFYSGKDDTFGSGVLSPRNTMYTTYSLKAGTWALACFWPDRKTGMPHAFMGMYRTIKVG